MSVKEWPDWIEHIWAKSPIRDEDKGEPLAVHTWENLSRLGDLARLKPWLPELCNFQRIWHVLFWATLLHDWGKIALGFQNMLKGNGQWRYRHEVLSLVFIEWIRDSLSEEETIAVIAIIASHHKDSQELLDVYANNFSEEDDPVDHLINNLVKEDIEHLWDWLHKVVKNWLENLGFCSLGVSFPNRIPGKDQAVELVLQKGEKIIRKNLRLYRTFVQDLRYGEDTDWTLRSLILRGTLLEVDYTGSAHTGRLPDLEISQDIILKNIGVKIDELHSHQLKCLEMQDASAVLIAPTGSGKTEAALFWASQQLHNKKISRLFYTLPYQASMNAMYDRLNEMFSGQVGLLHSRSKLALYRRLMERDYEPHNAVKEVKWLGNLAKLHYHPLKVFSPYQMLKAVYQLKGYETMLADYAGSAFVLDEIHAYEPERLALILEFVKYLRQSLGAHFFVMSATMPSLILNLVEKALGEPNLIYASKELYSSFTRHIAHLETGDLLSDEWISRIAQEFQQGESILVTCNTVTRAQEAYRKLSYYLSDDSLVLVHGRFNGYDRLIKERFIVSKTALKSSERRPIVVVSTQVIEVSLNIDLDILYSDPAPLEALVQRFGRINRGRRRSLAPVHIFTEPITIYNVELVEKALKILSSGTRGLVINEEIIQSWLDQIYTGKVKEDWLIKYNKVANEFREIFVERLLPFNSDQTMARAFERLFDGVEILPLSLVDDYKRIAKDNLIEASQYIVPITWRQFNYLKKNNLVYTKTWPYVVDIPYSSKFGLGNLKED